MALSLIVPGAGDLAWARWAPPVTRGVVGAYIFGGTEAQTRRNHANAAAPLRMIGAPVFSDSHVKTTGGVAYFEADMPETTDVTFVAVARTVTAPTSLATGACIIGNYAGAGVTALGASLYADYGAASDRWRMNVALDNGGAAVSAGADVEAAVTTNWALLVGTAGVDQDKTRLMADPGGLLGESAAWAYNRAAPTANKLRIGSAYSSLAGEARIAMALIYSVVLTSAEIAQVEDAVRPLMAARGITV